MKKWNVLQISLFVAACVLLSCGGRLLALRMSLPIWLDSFGTMLCACVAGPLCGSIVGAAAGVIFSLSVRVSFAYIVSGVMVGAVAGLAAGKSTERTLAGAVSWGGFAGLCAALVSTPLDLLYYGGSTGNLWGDGVMRFLEDRGAPAAMSLAAGEAYINFPDKLLALAAVFLLIRLWRRVRAQREMAALKRVGESYRAEAEEGLDNKSRENAGKAEAVGMFTLFALAGIWAGTACLFFGQVAYAQTFSEESITEESIVEENISEEAADYNNYVQTIYSSNNGLPCGEANDIAQTNDGILWIGTYAGLYRYNGSEFRWMDDYDSVRNVNCLYVDMEGRLWIGSNDNGLSIAINEHIVNVVDQSDGLPSNSVRSIVQSTDGYYYVGTTGSMQVLSLNNGLNMVAALPEVNYADHSAAGENGYVAAVTSDGRLFLMRDGGILSSMALSKGEELFGCCSFDAEGRLQAGTSQGRIYTYDISGGDFKEIASMDCEGLTDLNDLFFPGNGEEFIIADNGIGYLDAAGDFHSINVNEFNNSIDNMLVDYQGNFWYTSSRLGLLRLSPSSFVDVYSSIGMESQVVNTVEKWQGNFYFGTDSGLAVVDGDSARQIFDDLTERLKGIRIRCMLADSADHLWICTYGQGLWEVLPEGEIVLYNSDNGGFGSRARMVTELSDGTILAGGDTGLSFIREGKVLRTIGMSDGLINSMILTVTELSDGTVLAGTDGDGIAVLTDGEVTRMYTREDGLSSEVILRTVADPVTGGIFIVTSNGLCYMDAERQIRPLDNFPYFNNYNVWVREDNTLFISGSAGIYVVDREELLSGTEELSYDLLNAGKGLTAALTANSWNYYDGDGHLYLSCDKGVYILDTDHYDQTSRSYRMLIASAELDGVSRRILSGSPIEAGRGVSRIELFPEIINFSIQNPYVGYYLEGFETQWNMVPQSSMGSVVYTNLPGGTYLFHLAVFDSNRTSLLEERVFELSKEREIYDYGWFRAYMLIVGMLAVAWLTWFIVETQVRRTLEMNRKIVQMQEKELKLAQDQNAVQERELQLAHEQNLMKERELNLAQEQAKMGNDTIITIAKTMEAKDARTSRHSQRVAKYSALIGQELGFSPEECENLEKAAGMHDIGKIGVPDNILNKPSRLDEEEYRQMKSHVTLGSEILKNISLIDHVVEGARYHHERYDGKGYPDGLKGEEIPLYGRIIGVADAFDAMTANRVYRRQMDFDYVLNEMRKGRGTQFDPQMVDILLGLIEEGKIDLNKLYGAPDVTDEDHGGGAGPKENGTAKQPAETKGGADA